MRTLPALAVAALLVAAGALAWFLVSDRGPDPALEPLETIVRPSADRRSEPLSPGAGAPLLKGGVYGGIVLDAVSEQPLAGASVLLVRFETGEGLALPQWRADGSDFDPRLLPNLGAYEVVGQVRTGPDGRFRLEAGARDVVRMVVAWDALHAPRYVLTGRPEEELRILLARGGTLTGTVVSPEGQPVRGAIVDVYLQSIARQTPQPSEQDPYPRLKDPVGKVPPAVLLGDMLGREIGPRVYGLDPARHDALRLVTGVGGTFTVGPVDESVQLWVVITHPDYMWTEFDELPGLGIRRPVLQPGQALERTYQLQLGNWIEGRVVSDQDPTLGVEGVAIGLRHVVNYKRHPWYETHIRRTVSRPDGSFRMSGLSHGPYVADLTHPSFGAETVGQIPPNTKNLVWVVKSRGALEGTIAGLDQRPPGGRVEVLLEPVGERGAAGTSMRLNAVVDERGTFTLERLPPGDYRASVRAGALASQPVTVSVRPHEVAQATFSAQGGAELSLRVVDANGRAIDPVSVTLVRLESEGGTETQLGSFVTRAGELDERGLAPGRFRLEVAAQGYLPAVSEPFALEEGRRQVLAPIMLKKPATLRIGTVGPERGRAPQDVQLELQEGDGPWRPVLVKDGQLLVAPGVVHLRARDDLGRTFSERLELAEGASSLVNVVLREP